MSCFLRNQGQTKPKQKWIDSKNTPSEYLAVRLQFVLVKKGFLGLKDKTVGVRVVIPNTKKEAMELASRVFRVLDSYKGVTLEVAE